jgi:hypothetical protein
MMMNRFYTLIISLLLFSFNLNAQEIYKVTADKLNVRQTKDPSSKKIGFVPQNENVQVLDSTDAKYFKIKVSNGEGWVSSQFLTKIVTAPVKQNQNSKPIIESKTEKDNSRVIFIAFAGVIMITLLFIIFKFVNNTILMVFSAGMVLMIGYFCYLTFILEKSVAGKFTGEPDNQYISFDFKSKDSVIIEDSYADTLFTTPYSIEGDMIKFKQQENTFLLMIRDNNTLIGEGFTKGVFSKK